MKILGIIGDLGLYLTIGFLTIVGILDLVDKYNFPVPVYTKWALKKRQQELRRDLGIFFETNSNYINKNEELFINSVFSMLNLNQDKMFKLRYALYKLQVENDGDVKANSIEKKLKQICISELCLINQQALENILYKKVKYFIDFHDLMFVAPLSNENRIKNEQIGLCQLSYELCDMLAKDILKILGESINEVTKVIIPIDGNLLFGCKVASILKKPFVHAQSSPQIFADKYWHGKLDVKDKVIIVNDVLVTGNQIIETKGLLPDSMHIFGFFCLLNRNDYNGVERLNDNNIIPNYIIQLNDEEIEKIVRVGVK
ncbi:MAG: hypothetical protein CVU84_15185 [Firmicutes bacterium HGW-Firmicutes-1]|jgi:adenine/guanine phosphoribosyltransferase-like PRPP-binding protein|nr:MAG: hypothetical protein CVU84_15185 [Firmicutes bacterium HGW-Firmicutes-1]